MQILQMSDLRLIEEQAALFRLFGDPTRLRILNLLNTTAEQSVQDLAAHVDASESSVSQALRLLRTARLVDTRRDGRKVFYRLSDQHARDLLNLSAEHITELTEGPTP